VSADYLTKGMSELGAYSWSYANPANPAAGFVQGGQKVGPVGRVGWQADLSTNKSGFGYAVLMPSRPGCGIIYQIECSPDYFAPGATTGYTAQSDVTKAAIATAIPFGRFVRK